MFFKRKSARRERRLSRRGVPRDLSPHLMRDIGLEPWPESPLRHLWLLPHR